MSKKTYTHVKFLESEILAMKESGKTKREIAEYYGLKMEQVKELLKRYRRRKRKIIAETAPLPKGRPRKDGQPPRQSEKKELERLRMENKLLRDFLQLTERK